MVVAGTPRDWDALDEGARSGLATALGEVVADAGGAWLTLRAYEPGDDAAGDTRALVRRHITTPDGRCTIIVDPVSDGRERFAEAMRHLPAAVVVDEKAVTGVLYEPADVEPDLVLVLGPPTRLPPSLVWELAYSELVFSPVALGDLRPEHLQQAVDDFHGRRRRFGGLDT
jgi:Putative undecaprenyl diphosphate synthase